MDVCAFVYYLKKEDKQIELLENPKHTGGFWAH